MSHNNSRYFAGTLIILSLLVSACKREEPTTWNAELLGPIAHGRITLADIVPDSLLTADDEGLWHLIFNESLTDFDLDSLVSIPDTLIEKVFEVPLNGGPFFLPNGTIIIEEEENNLINVNNVQLREVIVKSGKLRYKVKSYINGYLLCTYSLPGVTLNGMGTVIETTTEPLSGNDPYVFEGEIDLTGYHIDFTGGNGAMYNRIYSELVIQTSPSAPQQAEVYGDDYVSIELEFADPVISYARGYFGNHHYSLNQQIDFSDNINMPEGALNLDAAAMHLHINNNVGVDMEMNFSLLEAYNSTSGSAVALDFDELFEVFHITRAHDNNGTVDGNEYDFFLNEGNSNIDTFMENLPDQLVMQAEIEVNPLGNVSDGQDFIYTDNALEASVSLDVPLNVGMQDLTLRDTMEIAGTVEFRADGELRLYVLNSFPFTSTVSAYITDASGLGVITLVPSQMIDAGIETAQTGVTIPVESVITIDISEQLIDAFQPGNKVVIEVRLNTPGYPSTAGLYESYFMDFKLIGEGGIELSLR